MKDKVEREAKKAVAVVTAILVRGKDPHVVCGAKPSFTLKY